MSSEADTHEITTSRQRSSRWPPDGPRSASRRPPRRRRTRPRPTTAATWAARVPRATMPAVRARISAGRTSPRGPRCSASAPTRCATPRSYGRAGRRASAPAASLRGDPAPRPSAASPAAITPGWDSSRWRSLSTSGQSRRSMSSAAASGVGSVGVSSIGFPNETRTRPGRGSGPANSFSVPVIAHGTTVAPVSSASRAAPLCGLPRIVGSRTRVPSGNSASSPPSRRICRAVSIASSSEEPRRTGNAPSLIRSRPAAPRTARSCP